MIMYDYTYILGIPNLERMNDGINLNGGLALLEHARSKSCVVVRYNWKEGSVLVLSYPVRPHQGSTSVVRTFAPLNTT